MPWRDDDAELLGLLDVAAPELVHAGEQRRGRLALDRELEDEARLTGGEALVLRRRVPAEVAQLLAQGARLVLDLVGHGLAEPGDALVGDGALDRVGAPAAGDHRRADADPERAGARAGARRAGSSQAWTSPPIQSMVGPSGR